MAAQSVTSNTTARARAGSIGQNSCRAAPLRTVPITEYPDESPFVANPAKARTGTRDQTIRLSTHRHVLIAAVLDDLVILCHRVRAKTGR